MPRGLWRGSPKAGSSGGRATRTVCNLRPQIGVRPLPPGLTSNMCDDHQSDRKGVRLRYVLKIFINPKDAQHEHCGYNSKFEFASAKENYLAVPRAT